MKKDAKELAEGGSATTAAEKRVIANKRKKVTKTGDDEDDDEGGEAEVKPKAKRGKKSDLVIKTDLVEKVKAEEDDE